MLWSRMEKMNKPNQMNEAAYRWALLENGGIAIQISEGTFTGIKFAITDWKIRMLQNEQGEMKYHLVFDTDQSDFETDAKNLEFRSMAGNILLQVLQEIAEKKKGK